MLRLKSFYGYKISVLTSCRCRLYVPKKFCKHPFIKSSIISLDKLRYPYKLKILYQYSQAIELDGLIHYLQFYHSKWLFCIEKMIWNVTI